MMEIVSKKGIAGKRSTLVSPQNDKRKIKIDNKVSPNTKIPNTMNSLLIK